MARVLPHGARTPKQTCLFVWSSKNAMKSLRNITDKEVKLLMMECIRLLKDIARWLIFHAGTIVSEAIELPAQERSISKNVRKFHSQL